MKNKIILPLEIIKKAIAENISIAGVIKSLNISISGGNYLLVKKWIKTYKLDNSHFTSRAGHKQPAKYLLEDKDKVLTDNSWHSTSLIKSFIKRYKLLEEKCECGLTNSWKGKPLVLRLDHINGKRNDHRLENLRFICPNCDSQSDTYCGRNVKKSTVPQQWVSRESLGLPLLHQETKIDWPSNEVLLERLKTTSFLALGRELGVSDNAIRKRLRNHK